MPSFGEKRDRARETSSPRAYLGSTPCSSFAVRLTWLFHRARNIVHRFEAFAYRPTVNLDPSVFQTSIFERTLAVAMHVDLGCVDVCIFYDSTLPPHLNFTFSNISRLLNFISKSYTWISKKELSENLIYICARIKYIYIYKTVMNSFVQNMIRRKLHQKLVFFMLCSCNVEWRN